MSKSWRDRPMDITMGELADEVQRLLRNFGAGHIGDRLASDIVCRMEVAIRDDRYYKQRKAVAEQEKIEARRIRDEEIYGKPESKLKPLVDSVNELFKQQFLGMIDKPERLVFHDSISEFRSVPYQPEDISKPAPKLKYRAEWEVFVEPHTKKEVATTSERVADTMGLKPLKMTLVKPRGTISTLSPHARGPTMKDLKDYYDEMRYIAMNTGAPLVTAVQKTRLPDIDPDPLKSQVKEAFSACECGAHKTSGAKKGDPTHSSWCPWSQK